MRTMRTDGLQRGLGREIKGNCFNLFLMVVRLLRLKTLYLKKVQNGPEVRED